MSATSPKSSSRPRVVNIAFGCWVAADILTAAFGLLMITSDVPPSAHAFIRAVGVLLVVVGVAHGFLAGRARGGNKRFAYAGVGLSLATVAFLALLMLFGASIIGIAMVALIMALMITGSALTQGKPAQAWFGSEGGS
jgi:hypothetical protein